MSEGITYKEILDQDDKFHTPAKECVGCDQKGNLEKCEGTMCRKCWEAECEEPNLNEDA